MALVDTMAPAPTDMPDWLASPKRYQPVSDRDGFISRSILSISSVLARFRLDDGQASPLSPSATVKVVLCLSCILLTSLSRNYLFVMIMLAGTLVRTCLLPRRALGRVVAGAGASAGLALVIMLPAVALGQAHSALLLTTKALVSTGVTLITTLTTPAADLTRALRVMGVPGVAILTMDLTLRSIVRLGETASEALAALRLRSVGRNADKAASLGGVGGVVLVKAGRSAQETYDAMRCRAFDGEYHVGGREARRGADVAWMLALAAIVALFLHLQGTV